MKNVDQLSVDERAIQRVDAQRAYQLIFERVRLRIRASIQAT